MSEGPLAAARAAAARWSALSARARALAVGAAALALRLPAVALSARSIERPPDFLSYDEFARLMLSGWGWVTTPLAVREPGYPAFMALAYALPGNDLLALLLLQALAGAAACALAYATLARIVREPVAAIAAFLMAASPHFVAHTVLPIREALVVALLTAFVAAFYRSLHEPGPRPAFASALWFVLLAHTDVRFLPLVIVLPAMAGLHRGFRPDVGRTLLWSGLFFAALMVPYQVRGYVATGRPVIVTERFLGRWLERTTTLAAGAGRVPAPGAPATREDWLRGWEAAKRDSLASVGAEERAYFLSGGRPSIRAAEVRWFLFREYWRFARFAPEYRPYPDGRFAGPWSAPHNVVSTVVVLPFLVLLPFALALGPAASRRLAWSLALFFAAHAALHVLVHARDRYRIPMEVVAAILMALALVALADWLGRRGRPVAAPGA